MAAESKHRTRWLRRRAWTAAALCCAAATAPAEDAVFFFNPESSIDSYATLKTAFDTYLAPLGPYVFQPFNVRATFEQALAQNSRGVYMLSGWHYGEIKGRQSLDAVLVGVSKGAFLQRKILSAKDVADVSALKGVTVAGTGSEDYLRTLLKQTLGPERHALVDSFKVLSVPKDIDALMAVSFGMAQAAISSEASLQKLAAINPKQHSQLKPLAQSEKAFLLIATVPRSFRQEGAPLVEILGDMDKKPEGVTNLKLLGLDGWKRVETLEAPYSTQLRAP
ncbi:PhnD/SsuA/transferrin family substrate-binding protein [Methylococcus capsulatus]|uniref:PhnD/SsuA/transferrin family substrate-binding protein n=1 Tax=Methylococcus capsulatus TaxID=414 RepID=UPI002FD8F433